MLQTVTKKKIVLTNDDGPTSPFLSPFAKALQTLGEVQIVIPNTEQSWVSSSMSRFSELSLFDTTIEGLSATTVNGTPADCVNLAIHQSSKTPPSLLVSGINVGSNAGLGFFLCSGTVGAATQGFLCGVPSIALSAHLPEDIFEAWSQGDTSILKALNKRWEELASLATAIIQKTWRASPWAYLDFLTINIPFEATAETPIVLTKMERAYFKSLFRESKENAFRHHFSEFAKRETQKGSSSFQNDIEALEEGNISITPIRYFEEVEIPKKLQLQMTAKCTACT